MQQMDTGFSEVFFGSYPILVEGDTEHAAFIAAIIEEKHELADRAAIVRARGKAILPGLIRMLSHFGIPFGIVHDIDWPFTRAGGANGMWGINSSIYNEIEACRTKGVVVKHRFSVPDFERELGGDELGKDKPLEAYIRIRNDPELRGRVRELMVELCDSVVHQPLAYNPENDGPYSDLLRARLTDWCKGKPEAHDVRLTGKILDG